MKVLVSANNVSGETKYGGASRFFKCVIDTLEDMGHEVLTDTTKPCDVAIYSHKIDKDNPAWKVFISHGIIEDESFKVGADKYISISEEVQNLNNARGFKSQVIGQPIKILKRINPNQTLRNILIIRREETLVSDPFKFLFKKYNVKISDPDVPIEEQIAWADLCITLGRGALESFAQGKPVLVADNRDYIGAFGDGYVTISNIHEIALNNFSGRRFKIPLTKDWIESELDKYNPYDSIFLHDYVHKHHNATSVVKFYLENRQAEKQETDFAFGCMCNDRKRLDIILRNSSIGNAQCFIINNPEQATKGLNTLLGTIEKSGAKIGILTHNDMHYREHWLPTVKKQIAKLPEDWVIAGIVGKDEKGLLCGRFHDMSSPLWIVTDHDFPVKACCIDECTIIVNMKSGFRFDEELKGFDLYGTYACLRANELGSAWIIDAWAEHYCTRFHSEWEPGDVFKAMWLWLYNRFPGKRLDSTVLITDKE